MSENQEDVVLTLADVQNAVRVIDHAAEQGSFKGWKVIEQVLFVRQRLMAFIDAAEANMAAAEAEAAAAEANETVEETVDQVTDEDKNESTEG